MRSVLFVCTGNICRSPTAEAVFRHYIEHRVDSDIHCDSAGTHGYHVGEAPDRRSVDMAQGYGIDMAGLSARQIKQSDFEEFDFLIAMDKGHERAMYSMCRDEQQRKKVKLLLDYCDVHRGMDVPDPYYGGMDGFERTYKLIEEGVKSFIEQEC